MSNNKQTKTDEWRPVRTHAVLRRFKRGPGKTKSFFGQQEDETLRRVVHEHPIFYLRAGLPFLLSLIFLSLVVWIETTNTLPGSVFPVLYLISGLFIVGSLVYGIWRIFELWWVNVYIITDKRVLTWRGLLRPTHGETTLDKVQQVAVEQDLRGTILSYGTVHVYLAGGKPLILENVPDPKGVRDDIEGISQSYKAVKQAKPPPPPPAEAAMASTLGKLAKKDPLPQLPDADEKWAHLRSPTTVRGPLRRFGGPFRLKCGVHYDAEEYTVMYIPRSRHVIVIRLIIPALLLLVTLVGMIHAENYLILFVIAFFVILAITGLMIIDYIDDIFILTSKRVIDINRRFIFLSKQDDTTTYDKISQIEVRNPNVILLALDIGDLFIETQGNNPNISIRTISHPLFVQDKIYEIKGFNEKVDKVKKANERKNELNEWFSEVLTTLEQRVTIRGVPNLQSLDVLTAIERANELGMEIVVISESAIHPNMGAGKVVTQIPAPGAVVNIDPANPEKPQIQVTLSK